MKKKFPYSWVLETQSTIKLDDFVQAHLYQLGIQTWHVYRKKSRNVYRFEIPNPFNKNSSKRNSFFKKISSAQMNQEKLFEKVSLHKIVHENFSQLYEKSLKAFCLVQNTSSTSELWVDPHRPSLFIQAGMAFGTGLHPTTRLCAQFLAETISQKNNEKIKNLNVLDVGCGSGILSFVAKCYGATKVDAIDNDAEALIVSKENAEKNHLEQIYFHSSFSKIKDKKYPIIVANIILRTLLELKDTLIKHLSTEGILICSGLLYKDCAELIRAFSSLKMIERRNNKGWSILAFQKK